MQQLSSTTITKIKVVLFVVCLTPLAELVYGTFAGTLGANPVETMTHITGLWALRLLLATLAISPVRELIGWPWLLRLRRTIALYAFFYAALHMLIYLVFDEFFDWPEIAKDIVKRPWLTAGFFSFVVMIPLAITSTNGMMKRLGRNWQRLHRLIYPIAAGAVLHYFWLVKRDVSEPTLYALILAVLLCARFGDRRKKRPAPAAAARHGIAPSA